VPCSGVPVQHENLTTQSPNVVRQADKLISKSFGMTGGTGTTQTPSEESGRRHGDPAVASSSTRSRP